MSKIGTLNISFTDRNARRRGPTSSEAWNDIFDEIGIDFAGLYDQWNNRLKTLTNTLPDGTVDSSIDAFVNGLDGQTLYVKSDAEVSDTTYYNSSNSRPKTVYEQFAALYTYVDDINEALGNQIGGQVFSASNMSLSGETDEAFDAQNVNTALLELYNLVDISGSSYLSLSGGQMTGPIGVGDVDGNFSTAVQIIKGSGSPEGVVTAPVGSLYLNSSGGAGTTLYIKESGTGNTGWSAV
jgi:hypothetical protein